ncbi:MAG: DUF4920 domain-containing protein [Tenacibaculum sp.]
MKKVLAICLVLSVFFTACKKVEKEKNEAKIAQKEKFVSFGDKINETNTLTHNQMEARLKSLNTGDTLKVKFASTIKEVCSKKGCWMVLPVGEATTMVRFKDYGFFMPLDSKGSEVIVAGKAFVKETTVDELRHYAEDAGKSKEEIAKITAPKKEYAFLANGVLMKQQNVSKEK